MRKDNIDHYHRQQSNWITTFPDAEEPRLVWRTRKLKWFSGLHHWVGGSGGGHLIHFQYNANHFDVEDNIGMVAKATWILASTFTLFNKTTTNVIFEDPANMLKGAANMFKAAVNMVNLIPDSAKNMVTQKVNNRLKNSERKGTDNLKTLKYTFVQAQYMPFSQFQ